MNDTYKIISALLAGFAVGAAAGILLAPEKGSDLRLKISDTVSEWADSIADAANSGMESVEDIKEKVEEKSNSNLGARGNFDSSTETSQKKHV
jgi:gas vesicle protein